MKRQSSLVTEAELSVLEYLWEHGASVVRDIAHGLYGDNTPSYHSTVNSLLDQLEAKGFVKRDRRRFAHTFSASTDRETLVGNQLQQIADSHFDGALTPMLLTLLDKVKISRRDRQDIRKIIENIR